MIDGKGNGPILVERIVLHHEGCHFSRLPDVALQLDVMPVA
jgi:hypothetical protein